MSIFTGQMSNEKKYNLSLTYEGYMAYRHNNEIEEALNSLDGTINTVL